MIFVTIGTSDPFDRLLVAVDDLPVEEELIVQHGASRVRPAGATYLEFLPFAELIDTIRRARAVVTHAGAGSVLTILREGKKPIVFPRLRRFGEAVDDHQVAFARRLDEAGLVVLAENRAAVIEALASDEHEREPIGSNDAKKLSDELRAYLAERIDCAAGASRR